MRSRDVCKREAALVLSSAEPGGCAPRSDAYQLVDEQQSADEVYAAGNIGGGIVALLILVGAGLFLAFIPAYIAAYRGRSFWAFWVFGLLLFVPALIVALVLQRPTVPRQGDIVTTVRRVNLDFGQVLQRGWTSKVIATDVIDGTAVVQVVGPTGASHWIAAAVVRPS